MTSFGRRKFDRNYCVRTFCSYAKVWSHEGVGKTLITCFLRTSYAQYLRKTYDVRTKFDRTAPEMCAAIPQQYIYVICSSARNGTTFTCKKTKVRNKHLC